MDKSEQAGGQHLERPGELAAGSRPDTARPARSPRLLSPLPAELSSDQQAFRRHLLDGPRGRTGDVPLTDGCGALLGPFAVMAVSPGTGEAVQELGAAIRYASGLDPLVREAAILLIAAHHRCAFEWYAHEPVARRLGLDDGGLALLHTGSIPRGLPPAHCRALHAVAVMLRAGDLDDHTYAATVAELGESAIAELVWLIGYYTMLALALRVFAPAHPVPPALPEPDASQRPTRCDPPGLVRGAQDPGAPVPGAQRTARV